MKVQLKHTTTLVGAATLSGALSLSIIALADDLPPPDAARMAAASRFMADTDGLSRVTILLQATRSLMVKMIADHGKSTAEAGSIVDDVIMPAMKAHLPELNDLVIQYWASSLSTEDLEAADRFYLSPTGQGMLAAQSKSIPFMVDASQQWAKRVLADILAKQRGALHQRGVDL